MVSRLPDRLLFLSLLLGFEDILFFRRPPWGCGGSEGDPPGQTSPSHSAPHLGPAAGAGRDPLLPAPSARPETPARGPGPAHPSCSALCGALGSFLKLRGCPRDNPPLVPNLGNWPLGPRNLEGRGLLLGMNDVSLPSPPRTATAPGLTSRGEGAGSVSCLSEFLAGPDESAPARRDRTARSSRACSPGGALAQAAAGFTCVCVSPSEAASSARSGRARY